MPISHHPAFPALGSGRVSEPQESGTRAAGTAHAALRARHPALRWETRGAAVGASLPRCGTVSAQSTVCRGYRGKGRCAGDRGISVDLLRVGVRAHLGAQGARASRRSWVPAACSISWRLLKSWMALLFWKSMRAMVMEAFQQLWSGHRKSISLRSLVTMVK